MFSALQLLQYLVFTDSQYNLHSCFPNKNNVAQRERLSSKSHTKKVVKLEFESTDSDPQFIHLNHWIHIKQICWDDVNEEVWMISVHWNCCSNLGCMLFNCTFILFYFWPRGIWNLSFPTRDWTYTPCIGRWSLNHWTIRKVPQLYF